MTDISDILPFECFVVLMLAMMLAIVWHYERKDK